MPLAPAAPLRGSLAALFALLLSALAPLVAAPAADWRVESAWIRWLPDDLPAGGYLTVINDSGHALTLLGASSDAYGATSLHRSVENGGNSQMLAVDHIDIAAHSRLDFAASGYHLMLMHPTRAVHPGDRIPITLKFAAAPALAVMFEVRSPDGAPNAAHAGAGTTGTAGATGMPGMPGMPGMATMPGMGGGH